MKIEILAEGGIVVKVDGLSRLQMELATEFYKGLTIDEVDLDAVTTESGFEFCIPSDTLLQGLVFIIDWLQAVDKSIADFQNLIRDVEEKINHFRGDGDQKL